MAGGYLVVNDDFSAVNNGVTKGNTLSTLTPYFSGNVHGIYQVLPIGDLVGEFAYGDWTNVTTGRPPKGGVPVLLHPAAIDAELPCRPSMRCGTNPPAGR